ncbi:MAG: hypothetical protein IT361_18595 [Gemmatimonadaceae bacterium]|nr:hypothetical protein [Gemmatimonadaceae bacterium]
MLPLRSRILLAAAAILMAGMFVFPIWSVALSAPQYPEGLAMDIRINTITGRTPNDLGNINNLNHYIGMKRIEPDTIRELRLMPYVVAALAGLALLAAATGRRSLAWVFAGCLAVFAVAGLADFWWWTWDYGHNLDVENAIIRVPGMSYQPPLIGTKQLLNFTATSWPAAGGLFAFAAAGLTGLAIWFARTDALRQRHAAAAVAAVTGAERVA